MANNTLDIGKILIEYNTEMKRIDGLQIEVQKEPKRAIALITAINDIEKIFSENYLENEKKDLGL